MRVKVGEDQRFRSSAQRQVSKDRQDPPARGGQARHGGLTIASRAYEAERGRPYGPWVDALRSAPLPEIPPGLRDGLTPLLPELSDERPGLEDTTRLYDAVAALLRHLARRAPLLLTIDDVHWLDERSVALLHYAVRNLRGRVPFLLSSRPPELTDNPACRRMLEALRRAGAVDDLALGPLPDADIYELIAGWHRAPTRTRSCTRATATRCWRWRWRARSSAATTRSPGRWTR